jgi:hypothetical protein
MIYCVFHRAAHADVPCSEVVKVWRRQRDRPGALLRTRRVYLIRAIAKAKGEGDA